ncbi:MAG: hypothetical protein AAFY71_03260 [Bacteroidota bacterium]
MIPIFTLLQDHQKSFLFASEKINTVMTVALVIFGGLLAYMIFSGIKVGRLEKKMDELENNA